MWNSIRLQVVSVEGVDKFKKLLDISLSQHSMQDYGNS